MKKLSTKTIVQIALLIAIEIVLTRFLSIQTPYVRIGFGFLPIAIIAMLHGPLLAGISYAVGDILGFMIFATGPYFPGITVSALLTGVIYGLFIYKKPDSLVRVIIAVAIVTVVVRMGLTTLWLSMLWEDAFMALLPARVIAALIMAPVQVICIRLAASERFYSILGTKAAVS